MTSIDETGIDIAGADGGISPGAGAGMFARRLAPALGAEVTDIDLAAAGDAEAAAIMDLLIEHKVLFFPGQDLSLDAHVTLARRFGPLEAHPNLKNPNLEHPEIFELAASAGGVADEWHTDLTFLPSPSVMSVLNMVACPDIGGDTMWTNLALAYDELSEPMRDLCDGLTALHDAHPHDRTDKMAIHPVVRHHPETGQRVLYVNKHFTRRIVEMSHEESEALLTLLTNWVAQPRFTVRYRWSQGTIAMWDNRCTQHSVLHDFVGERIIQRATITGDVPTGQPARWSPWSPERIGALTRHDRQLLGFLRQQQAPSD